MGRLLLLLDSVRLDHDGQDITGSVGPLLAHTKLVLAEQVEIEDCQTLLR